MDCSRAETFASLTIIQYTDSDDSTVSGFNPILNAGANSDSPNSDPDKIGRLPTLPAARHSDTGEIVLPVEDIQPRHDQKANHAFQVHRMQGKDKGEHGRSGYIYDILGSQGQTCKVLKINATMMWHSNDGVNHQGAVATKVCLPVSS